MSVQSAGTRSVLTTNTEVSLSASNSNINSLSAIPSTLLKSNIPVLSSKSTLRPDSVSSQPSKFHEREKAVNQRSASDHSQSTQSLSNQYSNKTKAKVHLGACSIGALTFGVLAGPVGLVFAPAYLNAICMAMYGGHSFLVGGTLPNQSKSKATTPKSEEHNIPVNDTPPKCYPSDTLGEEEEEVPNNSEVPPDAFRFNGKGRHFTFAPVYAPNITINEAPDITINGNIYFMQASETGMSSSTSSPSETLTKIVKSCDAPSVCKGEQVVATHVEKITPQQVSKVVGSATSETGDPIADMVLATGESDIYGIIFNDGVRAIGTGLPAPLLSVHNCSEGPFETLSPGSAQSVSGQHSNLIASNSNNITDSDVKKNANSDEMKKSFYSATPWQRGGNGWIPRDAKAQDRAPVILSPGSAQSVSGQHSNLIASDSDNIVDSDVKKSENGEVNNKLPFPNRLRIINNKAFLFLDPKNLIFEQKT